MTRTIDRRGFLQGTGAVAATLAMPAIVSAQPKVTLKISHYLPATHGFQVDFIRPWAENLKQASGGAIDYQIFDASTTFGRADRQGDQVKAGVTDIALGLCGIPRGRFPHSSIMELPFVVDRAESGSRALWQLHQDGKLGKEYEDFKVLMLMTHHGALIHTVDKPVRQLADIRGLRMRTPGPAVSAMIEHLGGSALTLPPSEIYQSLSKGAIDGLMTTWDLVGAIHANEVLKYHTDCRIYAAAFYYVMNRKRYEGLPRELQQLIDASSGDALLQKVGPWWDKWESAGKEDAMKRKQEIIVIDDAERDKWREQLAPMIDSYLAGLSSQGVSDPQALYKEALALVAKHRA